MRFKKLQIQGFKSFGEPTEVVFEPGVTAVVGPNGCGKSNIADAIKWVLGEQSPRELRGGRMEDLIFNGSDRRDPVNYAEVSLTLDNTDKQLRIEYTEVTISRRLFRSGESLYLLNGTVVRLKDVHELLMGTGVGTSAYSLFEQGRIEQIISARPEDRRAVFEEAAGITKYKSQKREAMRKLDDTEANLLRVSDVIAEVKRQIQALERQVRRAKAYQDQFEELKHLEGGVSRKEMLDIQGQSRAKESELSNLRGQVADLETRMSGQEESLRQAREAVHQTDQSLGEARAALLSITHGQENLRHRLDVNRERIAEAETRKSQIFQEMSSAEEQVVRLKIQMTELITLVAEADAERQKKEEVIAGAQDRLDECARILTEAEKGIASARDRLLEETNAYSHLNNETHQVQQETTHLEARLNRLKMERAKVLSERLEAESLEKNLKDSLDQATSILEVATQERATAQRALSDRENTVEQSHQRVNSLEQEQTKVNSQLDLLKGLLARHEGYSSGVKALLTAMDQGRLSSDGVNGVLAELIQVHEEDTAAVDAALGHWAEAMVVDSAEVAERCRLFLEETKGGRVLFLICDRVPENGILSAGAAAGHGAVSLLERVGITPHLEPLLKIVLGDVCFVRDRQTAQSLSAAQTNIPFSRIVTPAGELFTVVSALLGETPAQDILIVGRKSRLESFEITATQLERHIEEARKSFAGAQAEYQAAVQVLSVLEAAFQDKTQELHRIEATHLSAEASVSKLGQEEAVLKMEQEEVEKEFEETNSRLNGLQIQLRGKEQELGKIQDLIGEEQTKIALSAKDREEISVRMATVKAELASFEQVTASRRDSLSVLEQSVQASENQVGGYREEQKRLQSLQEQWEAACGELQVSLNGLTEQGVQASAGVVREENRKFQIMEEAQAQEKQWMALGKQMEGVQGQFHQMEMEIAQLNFQREQILSRMVQMYQVNLDELQETEVPSEEPMPLEQMKNRIAELSQKLQKMGPVNLASIDEERELQSRYEHLVTQQADLVKAKEDLHEAITKINRTTRTMFRETFQAIQKEFQVTYKQLFGGGEARLVLMDEEDVLESGIEIIARPPGKPLQPISLLSGGEKALTTIALLFAIFRIKPSPFCLLDEIDAPLDETNVGRFTNALKDFLKDSQFIIITHNKKTMTMADVMYGITMEESGVSRVVSVKFKKKKEAEEEEQPASAEIATTGSSGEPLPAEPTQISA